MSRAATPTIRAKVVLIGAPGVGKSSLARRYVHSMFSDEYRSTLGVKIDRKVVQLPTASVSMVIWDMHGETAGLDVPTSYLRGASGALAVFDATRPDTSHTAASLLVRVRESSPHAVSLSLANKSDLVTDQEITAPTEAVAILGESYLTSAKTGDGVDAAFTHLAASLVERAGLAS